MKETPILFSGPMVRAILEGRKTQTRRVVGKEVIAMYGLHADRITAIHSSDEDINKCYSKANSSLSKFGLHGGQRWPDLLQNQVCRIWAEGYRGLVSVERSQKRQGIPVRFSLSPEQESNKKYPQVGLHGVSRNATNQRTSSSPSRWKQGEQSPDQFGMGNSGGELGGQGDSRARHKGRQAPCIEAEQRREIISALGNLKGSVQPKEGCQMPWDVPSCNLGHCQWVVGSRLWVKETWVELLHTSPGSDKPELCEGDKLIEPATSYVGADGKTRWTYSGRVIAYRATSKVEFCDGDGFVGEMADKDDMPRWKPSIFMPRWASRITLEITSIRVERVNEITQEDAIAEGCETHCGGWVIGSGHKWVMPTGAFRELWDSINSKRGFGWDANPWVWVIGFRRVEK